MARPATDLRERALAAAVTVVIRDGAVALTMDAVAKEAGVSKGGVLHHFSTKEGLVGEVVAALVEQWEAAVQAQADADPEPVGRYVRAFLEAMSRPELAQVGRGLLAAVAVNPELLDPMRQSYLRCQKKLEADGIDKVTAYQCILVADALWYGAIFELPAPPDDVLTELRRRCVEATRRR